MRILVLGGTAFLSAEIARQALAAGHDVTCLARGTAPRRPTAPPGCGRTARRAPRRIAGAADQRRVGRRRRRFAGPAARRGRPLEALAGSARHWTFVSSCSVYADHSSGRRGRDAGVPAPLAPGTELSAGNYGEAKSAIEHWTRELRRGQGPSLPGRAHRRARATARTATGTGRPVFARDAIRSWSRTSPRTPPRSSTSATSRPGSSPPPKTGPRGAERRREPVPFAAYLEESRQLADVAPRWSPPRRTGWRPDGANYWAGPDSLPLWLPPGHGASTVWAIRPATTPAARAAAVAAGVPGRRDDLDARCGSTPERDGNGAADCAGRERRPATRPAMKPVACATPVPGRCSRAARCFSPATGSRLSVGAIRAAWAAAGFENGRLGYPTTNEYPAGAGVAQYPGRPHPLVPVLGLPDRLAGRQLAVSSTSGSARAAPES